MAPTVPTERPFERGIRGRMRTPKALLKLKQRTRVRTRAYSLRERARERQQELRTQALRGRYAGWRRTPVRSRAVLYESFSGNGALCNPEAIFRYLLEASDFSHLQHIWALDDLDKHQELRAEFAGDDRVSFVEIHSPDYLKALA